MNVSNGGHEQKEMTMYANVQTKVVKPFAIIRRGHVKCFTRAADVARNWGVWKCDRLETGETAGKSGKVEEKT